MADDVDSSWDKFLDPEQVKTSLILSSLFITSYELFKDSVVGHLKGFFATDFDSDGPVESCKFRKEVLSRHKSPTSAALSWFEEMGAITARELEIVERARKHRNRIAHELPMFLYDINYSIDISLFVEFVTVFENIERWWALEIVVPTNPDFDGEAVEPENVHSGIMLSLKHLISTALDIKSSTESDSSSE